MKISGPITLIKQSFKIFFEKQNFIYFLKVASVPFILSTISFIFSYYLTQQGYSDTDIQKYIDEVFKGNLLVTYMWLIWSVITFILTFWTQVAGYYAVKQVYQKGPLDVKDAYISSLKLVGKYFLVTILVGFLMIFGLILLIIPGIVIGVWNSFSPWFVVDGNQGVIQSMKSSKQLVKGRFWKVLGRMTVFLLFTLSGSIVASFVPAGYGSTLVILFTGLFMLPIYLLFKELQAQQQGLSSEEVKHTI